MAGVVCAIRGGPGSRPTIHRAVELAGEYQLPLYFLYVVNLDFLARTTSSRTHSISEEMRQMGEFILLNATSTAESAGVPAEGIVRHGNVGEEIIKLSQEKEAEYVVLGRPQGEIEENVFDRQQITDFAERIEGETGAKVVFVEDGAE